MAHEIRGWSLPTKSCVTEIITGRQLIINYHSTTAEPGFVIESRREPVVYHRLVGVMVVCAKYGVNAGGSVKVGLGQGRLARLGGTYCPRLDLQPSIKPGCQPRIKPGLQP